MIACKIQAEKRVSEGLSTLIPRLILLKDLTGIQKSNSGREGRRRENEREGKGGRAGERRGKREKRESE